MDGDEDMDVLACGELNDEILWWENDGDENFTEHMVDSQINAIHTVIPRDVDLDGDMDVLAAACMSSQVAWYENDGNQNFTKHYLGYCAGALWLDAADLDNDGDNDLFGAPQGASKLAWWENPGNQQFVKHNINSTFTQSFCVVPAMMDNDNDIDLVAIGWNSNKISWFENKLESPNLLENPESVVFDSQNNRYLVSNWGNGNIIQIDSNSHHQYFSTILDHTAGLHIVDDILYASSNYGMVDGLIGFNMSTGEMVSRVDIDGKQLLNDITSDTEGNIYVTDSEADKIYKVQPSDSSYTTFVGSGLGTPNGIYYDEPNNRLLVLNESLPFKPIIAVNLNDSTTTTVAETNKNAIDGLTADSDGNFYFSSWETDCIYKYDEMFSNPPEMVSWGHKNPADIFYNQHDDVLAIPCFGGDTLELLPMGTTDVRTNFFDNKPFVKAFPNPFTNSLNIEYSVETACLVDLSIYNLTGQRVKNLVAHQLKKGNYKAGWNGENRDGADLQPGIYFCKFIAGNSCSTIKLIKTD